MVEDNIMSKEIKISIPQDISVEHYISFGNMDHLSTTERVIRIVSVIANVDEEEVKKWSLKDVSKIYSDLNQRIIDIQPNFFPVFEWKGREWGFQPIHKMTGGEFVELETALKGGIDYLAELLAILYRPVIKNKLDGLEWKIKHNLKYVVGKSENLFKYYEIEDFDVAEKEIRKELFKQLPIQIGLGAYSFFLSIGEILLRDIPTYFPNLEKVMTKEMMKELQQLLSTTGGLAHSIHSQKMEESFV